MKQRSDISEELQLIAPSLAAAGMTDVFVVPEGYFEQFPAAMLAMAVAENLVPANIGTPFLVPVGYFDAFPGRMMERIDLEDDALLEIPVLQSIGKAAPYTMPSGYFDKAIAIPAAEKANPAPAKIVSLKTYRRFVQYAAAAMLAGVLVTGAFMYTDSKDYLKEGTIENTADTDATKSNELAGTQPSAAYSDQKHAATEIKTEPTFTKKIQSLTEEEMNTYLEENAPSEPIQVVDEGEEGQSTASL